MRVILFQDRFAGKVRDGSKCQTIRKTARCKPGDVLSLRRWTGKPYRSKQEVLLETICTRVDRVVIDRDGVSVPGWTVGCQNDFAKRDGFVDFGEMVLWFGIHHALPFVGYRIQWPNGKAEPSPCGPWAWDGRFLRSNDGRGSIILALDESYDGPMPYERERIALAWRIHVKTPNATAHVRDRSEAEGT
ncbi:MAG TPA: hypothetical protein VMV57_02390 [Terracidiphilus sp.]|nr:hypothetical protein [Terracidiphilus sp.]